MLFCLRREPGIGASTSMQLRLRIMLQSSQGARHTVCRNAFAKVPACAGIVSYSSRIIAAMRAIEDEEPDKLFDDPLARVLAGDKAMKRVYQLLKVQLTAPQLTPTLSENRADVCRLLPGRRQSGANHTARRLENSASHLETDFAHVRPSHVQQTLMSLSAAYEALSAVHRTPIWSQARRSRGRRCRAGSGS